MTEARISSDVVYMIVGMHRSGTSSIGRLMQSIGFDFGDNLLEGVDSINDRGFWEDRDVVALDEHIFQLYGSSWFDFERLPGKWWEDAKIKDLVGVAETWFHEGFSHEKPIAVKDPRFCRLLPFWKRVFLGMGIRPHILFVIRNPAEVAASIKHRDGFSLQIGYLLWLAYVIDGLYYSRNLDLAIIDYEAILANPEKVANRLARTDVASVHGLSEADLLGLVKNNLDSDSRHQRADSVLTRGEVQGDVQTLAHELYDVLVNATPDDAKLIADKYRKRFYRMLDHHKEVLSALQATVNKQVETNQKLSEIGGGHSYALTVIHDKDMQLEENKDFIAKCLAEIGKKESLLAFTQKELERNQLRIVEQESLNQKNNALWDRFEELQQVVHGRELKLSESLGYIEKCEAWIGELNLISEDCQRMLVEQRDYIARCEARIQEQDQWLSQNSTYIAKCEARIKEQDSGLAENTDYILRCETRIHEQDDGLQRRDQMLGERLEKIVVCEARIAELDQLLALKQKDFSDAHDALMQANTDLQSRCAEIELLLENQQEKISANQLYLRQCEEYIQEQDRAVEEQSTNLLELNRQVELLQKTISEGLVAVSQKEEVIAAQGKQIADKNTAIEQHEMRIAEQAKVLETHDAEIENRKLYIVYLEQQVSELTQIKNRQEGEIACHLAENSRLQQLDMLNKQRMAIQKKQIDSTKTHAAALESELVAVNAQITRKQQELERYRSYRVVRFIDKFSEANS